jgi:hypothetical protein
LLHLDKCARATIISHQICVNPYCLPIRIEAAGPSWILGLDDVLMEKNPMGTMRRASAIRLLTVRNAILCHENDVPARAVYLIVFRIAPALLLTQTFQLASGCAMVNFHSR